MSDPYNQYSNYGSPAPSGGQGYPPPSPYDQQQGYQHQNQSYPQQGYPPQGQQYVDAPAGYGPPQRVDSYGPPQQGGFQHGQQGGQYGAYNASNPQGHPGY